MTTVHDSLAHLSEEQLLDHFGQLVLRDRANTARLLVAIAEIDERKLWAKHACPSMFAFCMKHYHWSEPVTAKRIWAARTARRFPLVLPMLARGELHLSAIHLLFKHLTPESHRDLLERAKHKSSREIEALVAHFAPKPDVPSRIRALPRRGRETCQGPGTEEPVSPPRPDLRGGQARTPGESAGLAGLRVHGAVPSGATPPDPISPSASAPSGPMNPGAVGPVEANSDTGNSGTGNLDTGNPDAGDLGPRESGSDSSAPVTPRQGRIRPLAPRRYKIEITVDQETHDKLRSLQDLVGHQRSGRDPATIIARAIDVLLKQTLKRKAAITDRPRHRQQGREDKGLQNHGGRRSPPTWSPAQRVKPAKPATPRQEHAAFRRRSDEKCGGAMVVVVHSQTSTAVAAVLGKVSNSITRFLTGWAADMNLKTSRCAVERTTSTRPN